MPIDIDPPLSHDFSTAIWLSRSLSCSPTIRSSNRLLDSSMRKYNKFNKAGKISDPFRTQHNQCKSCRKFIAPALRTLQKTSLRSWIPTKMPAHIPRLRNRYGTCQILKNTDSNYFEVLASSLRTFVAFAVYGLKYATSRAIVPWIKFDVCRGCITCGGCGDEGSPRPYRQSIRYMLSRQRIRLGPGG